MIFLNVVLDFLATFYVINGFNCASIFQIVSNFNNFVAEFEKTIVFIVILEKPKNFKNLELLENIRIF